MPGLSLIDGEVCPIAWKGPMVSGLILTWFWLHSWRGLLVYFSNDDIMNLYWARETPFWRLVLSALAPFTTVYRPTGAVLYRCLYALFGLRPFPFRIVCYALLLTNLALLYKVTLAITGRRAAGALAAFLASFHSRFSDLYLNNGTIYDVLCGSFYFGAILYYISIRSHGRALNGRQVAILYLLATAALNAKEMAATLPVVLLFYELLRGSRPIASLVAPLCVVALVMGTGAWARFRDASRLMHNDLYALHLSLGLPNTAAYLNDVFYRKAGALDEIAAPLLIVCLFAIAALARSGTLLFWALFILITPLPVLFIPHRTLYAFYVPVFGWAAFAATLLVRLSHWARFPLPALALFITALLLVKHVPIPWSGAMPEGGKLYALHNDLLAGAPSLPRGSHVLFLNDAFQGEPWTPLMLLRLTYNDLSLELLRPRGLTQPDRLTATAVFDYVHGHMIRTR